MERSDLAALVGAQKRFLRERGGGVPVPERRAALRRLHASILEMEGEICAALKADLNKGAAESYMTEIGLALREVSHMAKRAAAYARRRFKPTPLSLFPASSWRAPAPYGVALIISPWNYPFGLSIQPLADAIGAGNAVVLKPSELSPRTAAVLQRLVAKAFDPGMASVVLGGAEASQGLLDQDVDCVLFTGGPRVGKIIAARAAEKLIPAVLELGGKSPCIVDETADLKVAARRIVFGKFLNAGQTCVAPDYLYCHERVRDALVREIGREVARQYSADPLAGDDYPKIVGAGRFAELAALISPQKVLLGGRADPARSMIEPTLLSAAFGDACMQGEIFGPILPVVTFKALGEAVDNVNRLPKPLALYVFSNSRANQRAVLSRVQFGGGCVNDVVTHMTNHHMGFGGVGGSGIGEYHGKAGFDAFSHHKSLLKNSTRLDIPLRYRPVSALKRRLLRWFLK